MRTLIAAALCLLSLPAAGQSLQGQWQIDQPPGVATAIDTYPVLIDAEHRAAWDVFIQGRKPLGFLGYVARINGPEVEIALTNRESVLRIHCTRQSSELLHCVSFPVGGATANRFALTRVGPGPKSLMRPLP